MSPLLILLIGLVVVVAGVLWFRLHAFLALVLAAYLVAFVTSPEQVETYAQSQVELGKMNETEAAKLSQKSAPSRVLGAFGSTCGKIGILIAMAAIIGKCLLDSGGAQRIVDSILALFGVARAQLAFLVSGFLLAIPVFFDTVFYLLIPLGKAMRLKTGKNYLLYILTIVAGATMAHSLVPPTPGPLFVAAELKVEIWTMIKGGLIVGLFTVSAGYFFAVWANKRFEIPLRDEAEAKVPEEGFEKLPNLFLAYAPIVLPVILIALGSWKKGWYSDKTIALIVGAAIALGMLAWQKKGQKDALKKAVQDALMSGGVIILITAAGGAFGGVLRETGIALSIQDMGAGAASAWAIPIAFGITALVRTAQGSATVAMITAVPIAAAMVGENLPFHPVYLALAIGCGSKPIPWMNDSGFWIITRMTGMKESETLRYVTTMMTGMGLVGLVVVMIGAKLFPLV